MCLTQIKLFRFIGFCFASEVRFHQARQRVQRDRCANWKSYDDGRGIMASRFEGEGIMRRFAVILLFWILNGNVAFAQAASEPNQPNPPCRVEATNYKGW